MSEARERFDRAMRLYHLRVSLFQAVTRLPDDLLARTAAVVEKLTPDELNAALGYAEGLAAWRENEQESDDATLAKPDTEAIAAGPARSG